MVSRLETGTALPTLEAGLMLQLALGANLAEVYIDLQRELANRLLKRAAKLPPDLTRSIRGRILGRDP